MVLLVVDGAYSSGLAASINSLYQLVNLALERRASRHTGSRLRGRRKMDGGGSVES